ncbi:hypothetical protein D3C72_1176180 [compost metagenome]
MALLILVTMLSALADVKAVDVKFESAFNDKVDVTFTLTNSILFVRVGIFS